MTSPTTPSSPPALITVEHLTRRLGARRGLTDEERAQVEDYIDSVTAVLLDEGLPTWTADTAPPRVRVIAIDAVERRLDNPEQLRQRSLSGDLEVMDTSGGWLTDAELKAVRRLAGKATGDVDAGALTSSRTTLPRERLAVMRTPWDAEEGTAYSSYVL